MNIKKWGKNGYGVGVRNGFGFGYGSSTGISIPEHAPYHAQSFFKFFGAE